MGTGCGVYGVGAVAGVCDGSSVLFLEAVVGEGLAEFMLAVPYFCGVAVDEADHVVFPVLVVLCQRLFCALNRGKRDGFTYSDVFTDFLAEEFAAVIVGCEVHVESVHVTIAAVVDDDGGTDGALGFVGFVGFYSVEPGWGSGDVVD